MQKVYLQYHGKGPGRENERFYPGDLPDFRFEQAGDEVEVTSYSLMAYGYAGTAEQYADEACAHYNAGRGDHPWLSYRVEDVEDQAPAPQGDAGADLPSADPPAETAANEPTGDPPPTDVFDAAAGAGEGTS